MWSLRRVGHPLRRQGCWFKVSGLLCIKPDTLSDFSGDKAGGCYPQLSSRRFLSRGENYHAYSIFQNTLLGGGRFSLRVSKKITDEDDANDPFLELGKPLSSNVIKDEDGANDPFLELGRPLSSNVIKDEDGANDLFLELGKPLSSNVIEDEDGGNDAFMEIGKPLSSIVIEDEDGANDLFLELGKPLSSNVIEDEDGGNDAFLELGKPLSSIVIKDDDSANDLFLELGKPLSSNVIEDINVEDEECDELVPEPRFLDENLSDSDEGAGIHGPIKEKASLELLRRIMESPSSSIPVILDNMIKEVEYLSQIETSKIIFKLQKRRMHEKALQLLKWLETSKHFEISERDYASRVESIAKVEGVDVAEKYIEKVPDEFRGELVYRTLLANFVYFFNKKKAEAIFEKMRNLGLPITIHTCNQMIILYRRLERRKIVDILELIEKENLRPSHVTFRLLMTVKHELKDTKGMEQLVEAMKFQGLQPDIHVLKVLARHYILGGLKDKAITILKEIEGPNLRESIGARSALLSLYASLNMTDDVNRIWTRCALDPTMEECLASIEAWGKLGKVEEADAVLEIVLQKWKKLSSRLCSEVLKVYTQNNQISKGEEFIKRMEDSRCFLGPLGWDGLVRFYSGAGDVEKAESILSEASQMHTRFRSRPLISTYLFLMEQYAKRGDIHNTEKWFSRMKESGYTGRFRPYTILIQSYINAKTPAYGFKDRMKAENLYPKGDLALLLAKNEELQRDV